MTNIYHSKSNTTSPEVLIDYSENIFKMSGKCLVSDAHDYFFKIIQKLSLLENIKCIFDFEYVNSSSLRYLISMLASEISTSEIIWYYEIEDFDIEEKGRIIKDMMVDKHPHVKFKIIEKDN